MSGWRNVGRIHTIPVDDIAEHSLCSDCACGPRVEWQDVDGVQHVIHNSFDNREAEERPKNVVEILRAPE